MAKKFETLTTTFGRAMWASLIDPDTKFDPVGDYKINLRLNEDEAQELIDKITAVKEEALPVFIEEATREGKTPKQIAKIKLSDQDPWDDDIEGEEGVVDFKFKQKAVITKRDGTTADMSVSLVDSKGRVIPKDLRPAIGNDSIVRVQCEMVPYNMATTGVGVSLRLRKVQIKELVEYTPDGPAFDPIDDDGGYSMDGGDADMGDTGGGYQV